MIALVHHPQGRFLVDPRHHPATAIAAGEFPEVYLRELFDRYIGPESVCVDIGAYIGFYTTYFAKRGKQVHAFEPQRPTFLTLCGNLALNDCQNVIPYNVALYDRATSLKFADWQPTPYTAGEDGLPNYAESGNPASMALIDDPAGAIPAHCLDQYELPACHFIKVDAQGADLAAMRGGKKTIAHHRPVIIFEFEADLAQAHKETLADYEGFLQQLGYTVNLIPRFDGWGACEYLAVPQP